MSQEPRGVSVGNSAAQLYKKLCEVHSESWMQRSMHYLSVMEPFMSMGVVHPTTTDATGASTRVALDGVRPRHPLPS